MNNHWIEVVGAGLYLLNKVYFLKKEVAAYRGNASATQKYQMKAWLYGLAGLPFVSYILAQSHDWIFAALEFATAPAMYIGYWRAKRDVKAPMPAWVDYVMYVLLAAGVYVSWWDLGGLFTRTQVLEMVSVATFFWGTWLLSSRESRGGYLVYLLMFGAAGSLLFIQERYFFAWQQVASAVIIFAAYFMAGMKTSRA